MALGEKMPGEAGEKSNTSGIFGENHGLRWMWDEETRTITVSGDDVPNVLGYWDDRHGTYHNTVFRADVECIRFADCTLRERTENFFIGLSRLRQIDFSRLSMVDIEDMYYMFCGCRSLCTLELSGFDTGNVRDMSYMFDGCRQLCSIDLSHFDTGNVRYMDNMFGECGSLTSLNLSSFDIGNVQNLEYMFDGCDRLKIIMTPRIIGMEETKLPAVFVDASDRETEWLNQEFSNTVLYRKK